MTNASQPLKLKPLKILTSRQRMRVAVAADCDVRTVLRCYASKPIRHGVAERILAAVRKLGLPEPAIVLSESTGGR